MANAASKSRLCSGRATMPGGKPRSECAIAAIVMRFLAEAAHPPADPVGDPVDHPTKRNGRIAEQSMGLGRIGKPAYRRLASREVRRLAKTYPESFGEGADAHCFGAADIQRLGWRCTIAKRAEHYAVGVALPDDVGVADGDIDFAVRQDFLRDVVQHAIPHIDRIVEPDQASQRAVYA